MEATVKVALDEVEGEIARLWREEAERSRATRVELMTLVAFVSEPSLLLRTQEVVSEFVRAQPSRTIVAIAREGDKKGIMADVALHRASVGEPPFGDALTLEATGGGRDWLPENVDRLVLSGLPVCLWWVGDLPDFDRLFDRMLLSADVVVVNSGETDLSDLQKLSEIAMRSRDRYALNDLTWIRLRPIQKLIARFFDDELGGACLTTLRRVRVEFSPRSERDLDVTSTEAALLFGWMAHALALRPEGVRWRRGDGWAEAVLGKVTARFDRKVRADVPGGTILSVALECDGARFEVERQDDPQVFRWSREIPDAPMPQETLRSAIHGEAALLVRCLERPKRDLLFEASLHLASRVVRSVAPRLSRLPAALD
jgi:glucose-6-phosphate dehydrogenase assembly protein OpcA